MYQIARLVKALFAIDFRSEWTRAVPESQQPLGVNMFPLGVNVVTAEHARLNHGSNGTASGCARRRFSRLAVCRLGARTCRRNCRRGVSAVKERPCHDLGVSNLSSSFKVVAPAVKKMIGEQTVRERLVKKLKIKLKEIPDAPVLSWKQRRRLMTLLKDEDAEGLLMDQDDQAVNALSAMIAGTVLQSAPSNDSLAIAQALMTEYPESLGLQEAFGGLYYRLRRLDESINAQFERVMQSIEQSTQTGSEVTSRGVV